MDIVDFESRTDEMIKAIEHALSIADDLKLFAVGAALDTALVRAGDRNERTALLKAMLVAGDALH